MDKKQLAFWFIILFILGMSFSARGQEKVDTLIVRINEPGTLQLIISTKIQYVFLPDSLPPDTTIIPPDTVAEEENGLYCFFYQLSSTVVQIPEWESLTPIDTFIVNNISPHVVSINRYFGLVFVGILYSPADGDYKFWTESDDMSRLYIDDELIVDNNYLKGQAQEKEGRYRVFLQQGNHTIRVEYVQGWGPAKTLRVMWQRDFQPREDIPPEMLFIGEISDFPPAPPDTVDVIEEPTTRKLYMTWNANTEPDLAGYRIRIPTINFEIELDKTYTLFDFTQDFEIGKTYRFEIVAFDEGLMTSIPAVIYYIVE